MSEYGIRIKNLISINLKNGYSIIAITKFDRNENTYRLTLYLKGDTYDVWELIEKKENAKIHVNKSTLFSDVVKIITGYYVDGVFDYYIERYDYMMKCFDKGNEFFESLGDSNDK